MSTPTHPAAPATLLSTAGRDRETFGFVNPPLVRGSTVLHDSVADMQARVAARKAGADTPITYGIYGGPTHQAFYDALNALEGGHRSWALPSGLTACAIAPQLSPGLWQAMRAMLLIARRPSVGSTSVCARRSSAAASSTAA